MKIIVLILSSISPPREMSLEVAQAISLVRPHEVQSELRKALTSFYYSCTSHVRLVTYLCFLCKIQNFCTEQDHRRWRYHRRLLDYQSPYFQLIIE